MSEDGADRSGPIGWLFVAAQFVLLGALGIEVLRTSRRPGILGMLGLGAAAAGGGVAALASTTLGRALRAHPAPSEDAVLRTDGPYAFVRHPIYLGVLMLAGGALLIARTGRALVAFGALATLLDCKTRLEERLLAERFPDYGEYAAHVPSIVPDATRLLG